MGGGQTDTGRKKNIALAHPYDEGKSCSKFVYILTSGFGEDIETDRWADAR